MPQYSLQGCQFPKERDPGQFRLRFGTQSIESANGYPFLELNSSTCHTSGPRLIYSDCPEVVRREGITYRYGREVQRGEHEYIVHMWHKNQRQDPFYYAVAIENMADAAEPDNVLRVDDLSGCTTPYGDWTDPHLSFGIIKGLPRPEYAKTPATNPCIAGPGERATIYVFPESTHWGATGRGAFRFWVRKGDGWEGSELKYRVLPLVSNSEDEGYIRGKDGHGEWNISYNMPPDDYRRWGVYDYSELNYVLDYLVTGSTIGGWGIGAPAQFLVGQVDKEDEHNPPLDGPNGFDTAKFVVDPDGELVCENKGLYGVLCNVTVSLHNALDVPVNLRHCLLGFRESNRKTWGVVKIAQDDPVSFQPIEGRMGY